MTVVGKDKQETLKKLDQAEQKIKEYESTVDLLSEYMPEAKERKKELDRLKAAAASLKKAVDRLE